MAVGFSLNNKNSNGNNDGRCSEFTPIGKTSGFKSFIELSQDQKFNLLEFRLSSINNQIEQIESYMDRDNSYQKLAELKIIKCISYLECLSLDLKQYTKDNGYRIDLDLVKPINEQENINYGFSLGFIVSLWRDVQETLKESKDYIGDYSQMTLFDGIEIKKTILKWNEEKSINSSLNTNSVEYVFGIDSDEYLK